MVLKTYVNSFCLPGWSVAFVSLAVSAILELSLEEGADIFFDIVFGQKLTYS